MKKLQNFQTAVTSRGSKHLKTLIDSQKRRAISLIYYFWFKLRGLKALKLPKILIMNIIKIIYLQKKLGLYFLAYRCKIDSKEIKDRKKN